MTAELLARTTVLQRSNLPARDRRRQTANGTHRRHGDRAASRIGGPAADSRAGQIILIRQYRYTIDKWIWELPAGSLKAEEDPDTAAARECEEEIGLAPHKLTRLRGYYPTPGFCDEEMIYYRCEDLRALQPIRPRRRMMTKRSSRGRSRWTKRASSCARARSSI